MKKIDPGRGRYHSFVELKEPRKLSDVEFLEGIIKRMSNRSKWVQGWNVCSVGRVMKMCVVGHANVVVANCPSLEFHNEYDLTQPRLDRLCMEFIPGIEDENWTSLQEWQDDPATEHGQVMEVLNKALEKAKRKATA